MAELLSWKLLLLLALIAPAIYVHFRGKVRHKLSRQLTDHSTFTAPYNTFIYMCSAVPNTPVLDPRGFPELELLQKNWEVIRDEGLALYDAGHLRSADGYNDVAFNSFFKRGWKRFYFKWYSDFYPSAVEHCPRTVELLKQVPTINAAMFTMLAPNSRLGAHRDPFAGSVRYHLGLMTPNSDDCRIYIDGDPHSWRDGEALLFDETYIHRAVNDTDEPRLILFCDVNRPLRFGFARAINRFVVNHLVKVTQTRNVPGERVGFVNHAFNVVYQARLPFKRLKKFNSKIYYGLKYAALIALLALFWVAV